ncbi:MAG TPA: YeeE/YedE family protein [Chloroflexota bacterium]|nr:YeeE/YedE family protein [Chloroflexota bacterium]
MSSQALSRPLAGTPVGLRSLRKWAVVALALAALVVIAGISTDLAVFWAVGLTFGFILQRSRLCFASAFRDLFLMREGRNMKAILAGMGVASLGFAFIMQKAVPDPTAGALPTQAHVTPVGVYLVLGGLLFGVGMVVAGGCVSGTMYRIGEGYVASLASLGGILLGLELAAHSWNWWYAVSVGISPIIWLPSSVGYAGALAITAALLLAAYFGITWWESGRPPLFTPKKAAEQAALTFSDKVAQTWRGIFVKGWPMMSGALALGVLNIFAFTYQHPLGVTGELSSWADRGSSLFGWAAPPIAGASQLAGCVLTAGGSWLTGNFTLDAGVIGGAFVAAVLASEFKVRWPRQRRRYVQSAAGGLGMGYGAGLAVGCTIGAFFSAIPSLGLNGWIFGLSLLIGAFGGVKIIQRIP